MRVLLLLMLSANVWVVAHKAELHRILVCDMCQVLRSDPEVLAKFADHPIQIVVMISLLGS